MRAVVADAGPLNYLVLIEQIDILPALFERVLVPETVRAELAHPQAPRPVRAWTAAPPSWIAAYPNIAEQSVDLPSLDVGERAAIKLAQAHRAGLILMDDRAAVAIARQMGFVAVGTIGLLDRGARRGERSRTIAGDKLSLSSRAARRHFGRGRGSEVTPALAPPARRPALHATRAGGHARGVAPFDFVEHLAEGNGAGGVGHHSGATAPSPASRSLNASSLACTTSRRSA